MTLLVLRVAAQHGCSPYRRRHRPLDRQRHEVLPTSNHMLRPHGPHARQPHVEPARRRWTSWLSERPPLCIRNSRILRGVEFEWDEEKSQRNVQIRGFPFGFAARIFGGSVLDKEDFRTDYGERRFVAIGMVDNRVLVVVYTSRGARRRIISARQANRRERHAYHQAFTG